VTTRINLINPMKQTKLSINDFIVKGDFLILTLDHPNSSKFFIFNSQTGKLLEHHDLAYLFPTANKDLSLDIS
jgi:hypothetical protein